MPVWTRATVPRSADQRQLVGYLEATLQSLEDWSRLVDEELAVVARLRLVDGISIAYVWDADTNTGAAPASGGIKADSGNLNSVTAFAASTIDQFGQLAIPPAFQRHGDPVVGGVLRVTNAVGPLTLALFIVGLAVERATDLLIPVVHSVHSGPGFAAGDFTTMQFWPTTLPVK